MSEIIERSGAACALAPAELAGEGAAHAPVVPWPARRCDDGRCEDGLELLIEETPVALVFNGVSHAVMLATPADLEDLALGFALSEGIVGARAEVRDIEVQTRAAGIEVALEISADRFAALKERRRTLAGRTGCGLCGVESLAYFEADCAPLAARPRVPADAIARAFDAMRAEQRLHALTRGAHAAAWAGLDGTVHCVREDVGRHNALDKLVGALARQGYDPLQGFVAISSRASYEIVHKAARCGIGVVAALSAPTAHAARSAARLGMTLVAGARGRRFVVVAGVDGVVTD